MGFFSFFSSFNNGVVKNNAAIAINKYLMMQYQLGILPDAPLPTAGRAMVDYVWEDAPSVFSGKQYGVRPSSQIVALAALGNFIHRNVSPEDKSFLGLIYAFNYADAPYLNDYRATMNFNDAERVIYNLCSKQMVEIMEEYENKQDVSKK